MTFSEISWLHQRNDEAKFIRSLRATALILKEKFLQTDAASVKKLPEADRCYFLIKRYGELCLFPDKEIIEKFIQCGFNKHFHKWFIPITEISSAFRKIEKPKNIKIVRESAFNFIILHLHTKIIQEVCDWGGFIEEGKKNKLPLNFKELHSVYRKRKTIHQKPIRHKDVFHEALWHLIDDYEKNVSEYLPAFPLKDLLEGRTDRTWIKLLVKEAFIADEAMSMRKFYIAIFDLLKLIIKDEYQLLTENDFDYTKYEDYDTYKFRRVKLIIDKK